MKLKLIIILLCTFFSAYAVEELPSLYKISAPDGFKSGKESFSEVLEIIKKSFYDSENVKEDDLYYAAIQGILRRISPPESPNQGKIWSEEERARVYDNLKEKQLFSGIKFVFDKNEGSLTVTELVEGSPATGLLEKNDRIMRVDDKELKGITNDQLSGLLSGDEGKVVKFKVVRDINVLDVEITLKEVRVHNCIAKIIDNTGYLRVKSFSDNISGEMKEHLDSFKAQKISRVILDLRNNTGGFFTEGVKAAELFLRKGTAIVSVMRSGAVRSDYSSRNLRPYDFAIAVLINGRTASSSEILASALHSNNKAVLIGENSYGKAIIEKPFKLNNGYSIKFSVGAMYNSKGETWHEDGLNPDIKSETDFTKNPESDPAVLKAIKCLLK